MKRFSAKDFREMPWKNGGGVTTELLCIPDASTSGFLLRISRAKVEKDGPFSFFPGIDRKLLILEGAGCRLSFLDKEEVLVPGSILEFPGEAPIDCKLIDGSLIDFNVMINRMWGTAQVLISKDLANAQFAYHLRTETLYQFDQDEVKVDFPEEEHIGIWIKRK